MGCRSPLTGQLRGAGVVLTSLRAPQRPSGKGQQSSRNPGGLRHPLLRAGELKELGHTCMVLRGDLSLTGGTW